MPSKKPTQDAKGKKSGMKDLNVDKASHVRGGAGVSAMDPTNARVMDPTNARVESLNSQINPVLKTK